MITKMNSSLLLFTAFILIGLNSCNKDNGVDDFEAYAESAVVDIETETRSGSGSCFELVFPITLNFPDGTTAEVDEKGEVKPLIKEWRSNNPDVRGRVKVEFPIDVITADGTLVSVDSRMELRQLRRDCIDRPSGDRRPCFRLVYPVTVLYPDGTTTSYETRREMRVALRRWKVQNPDATTRPVLNFPLTIKTKDGEELVMNSREELVAYKENCE